MKQAMIYALGRACLILILALAAATLPAASPVWAITTFQVTTNQDPVPNGCNPGDCSLREAVEAANGSSDFNEINVPPGEYRLTYDDPTTHPFSGQRKGTQLVVTGSMSIRGTFGTGATNTVINGLRTQRVFDVAGGGRLSLSDIAVQNGQAGVGFAGHTHGGGIHNHGSLSLNRVILRDNVVPETNGMPDGGGIYNAGTSLSIDASAIINNTATTGGGIRHSTASLAQLTNVTFSGNTAHTFGGAIYSGNPGVTCSSLSLTNVTIANNRATSAGGGLLNLHSCASNVQVQNTIFANSAAGGNCAGSFTSRSGNISSDASCGSSPSNPRLGPLQNNGGSTPTHALLPGSPAIDGGLTPGFCPSRDQRDVDRPQDGNGDGSAVCDSGAYEAVRQDLRISFMTDSPDPVLAGGELVYTIDVLNPGPGPLNNVRLTDTLPAGVAYISFSETRGGSCAHAAGTVTCSLAALDGNRVWTVFLRVRVNPATTGTLSNTAAVSAEGTDDPNPSNNTATETTTVTQPPQVRFGAAAYAVNEGAGQANVSVQLSAASEETVTVQYATSNGTAMAGSDYTAKSGTLTFSPGQTSKSVAIPITNDTADEPNETINLVLRTPTNATLGTPSSAVVTIVDNDEPDPMPQVSFRTASASVSESAGQATLTVQLSAASTPPVTVVYATSDGRATAGRDYTPKSETLTFSPGQTSRTFTVPILNDADDEPDETINLTLRTPSNATLGPQSSAILTIVDDDGGSQPPSSQLYIPLVQTD